MRIRRAIEDSPPASGPHRTGQPPSAAAGKAAAVAEPTRQGLVDQLAVQLARPVSGSAGGGSAEAVLRARYPKVCLWYGRFTGRWWALLADHLVETSTAGELNALIAMVWPVEHRPLSSSGGQPNSGAEDVSGVSGSVYASANAILTTWWDGMASSTAPALGARGRHERTDQGFWKRCGVIR
jgi:hypothetical protein